MSVFGAWGIVDSGMNVLVVNEPKKLISGKYIQTALRRITAHFLKKRVRNKKWLKSRKEITVVFLSEAEMKKINFQYRKKNKSTDILSFASGDPDSMGELLLCLPVLKRQAKEHGQSLEAEVFLMLTHGFLHLLGYDHELLSKEERLMERLQSGARTIF